MNKIVIAGIIMLLGSLAAADLVSCTPQVTDQSFRSNGTTQGSAGHTNLSFGVQAPNIHVGSVLVFQVPDLNGKAVTGAELSLTFISNGLKVTDPNTHLDIYGVRYSPTSSAVTSNDYLGAASLLVENWLHLDSTTAPGTYTAGNNAALTSWIADQVGTTGGGYIILSVRQNAIPGGTTTYSYLTANSANATENVPTLTLTTIPEPATVGMLGLGTALVMAARRCVTR